MTRLILQEAGFPCWAEVFWPFEKQWGLVKDHIGGEDRWEKRKRKTEKTVEKGHTGCFWQVPDWQ